MASDEYPAFLSIHQGPALASLYMSSGIFEIGATVVLLTDEETEALAE